MLLQPNWLLPSSPAAINVCGSGTPTRCTGSPALFQPWGSSGDILLLGRHFSSDPPRLTPRSAACRPSCLRPVARRHHQEAPPNAANALWHVSWCRGVCVWGGGTESTWPRLSYGSSPTLSNQQTMLLNNERNIMCYTHMMQSTMACSLMFEL